MGVFVVSAIRRSLIRLVGRTPQGSCVILYYHSIPPDQRAAFARQLDLLLHHAKPIAVSGKVMLTSGIHNVGITFDDALENFFENAAPELRTRRIPATVFVVSEAIGKVFGSPGCLEKVMSLQQLRELPEELVTLGSHTATHPFLPAMNREDARQEFIKSRTQLEEILGRKVLLFSFPFGGFTEELVELCREAGYQTVFTTLPYLAFKIPDEFVVGRIRVDPTDWPLEYRLKLAGAYRWLPWAFALKKTILSNAVIRKIFSLKGRLAGAPAPQAIIQESQDWKQI